MDWWQYILLYLGIWILGFFTGMNAGTVSTLNRLAQGPKAPPQQPGMPDLAMLQGLMNSQQGGRQ